MAIEPAAVAPAVAPMGVAREAEVFSGVIDPVSKRMLPLFFAIIAVVGFRLHEQLPLVGKLRPALVLTVVAVITILVSVPKNRLRILKADPVSRLVLIYIAWAFCTIPTSLWQGNSIDMWTGFAFPVLIIFAIVAAIRPSTKTLDTMHVGYVACTILLVTETMLLGRFQGFRLSTGATLDSNDLASVAALGFPLAVTLAVRRRGVARVVGIIGVIALLIGLGKFNSRGGTVAFVAGAVTLMLLQPGARKVQLFVLMAIAGAAFWATAPEDYRSRIVGMNDLESDYNYTSYFGRKAIWGRARGYIIHNPVFGVGIDAFMVAEGQSNKEASRTGKWSATHNAYLQAGSEMGVPGMLLFIGILGTAGVGASRLARRRRWRPDIPVRPEYLASLVGFATGAYFLSHAYFFPLFALLALCSYAIRVGDAESASGRDIGGDNGLASRPPPGVRSLRPRMGT